MNVLPVKKASFIARFKSGQSLRLHMTLILLATAGAGLLATRLLLALQMKNVVVRYPLAVLFAYLTFFICVKLWLKYLASFPGLGGGRKTSSNAIDWLPGPSGSGGGSLRPGGGFRGGGGNFGGGGASGSFGEADAVLAGSGAEMASGSVDAGGGVAEAAGSAAGEMASGLDLDDGWWVALVLLAIAAVFFGVGIYLIYEAPFILSEAAFNFLLAGGLVRGARRIERGDWMGSIFRATWIPLALTLLLALLAGFLIHHFFPGVTHLSELWKH